MNGPITNRILIIDRYSYWLWGMVSIKHGTILHSSDSARPIGHGPIVNENNRAPYRLDKARSSTGLIVDESVMQKRFSTSSIVHRYNCAPVNIYPYIYTYIYQ